MDTNKLAHTDQRNRPQAEEVHGAVYDYCICHGDDVEEAVAEADAAWESIMDGLSGGVVARFAMAALRHDRAAGSGVA